MIDSAKYQAQASELSQKLWAIANDLRGNMDSTKFRNYILGTIFYSYLSERTEEYMQEILKEDGLTYEQAFSDADYRPVVEQWSIEHLGYIIKPENLFRELVRKIVRPADDADKFSVEDYERAVNELTGSTMGQASEAAFSGLFNDMKLQDPDLGDTVAERTALISKVIVKISEIDFSLSDSQFDVLGTAYMILIGLFGRSWWRRWRPSVWTRRRRWATAPAARRPCFWRCRSTSRPGASVTSTGKRTTPPRTTSPA